ncbi:MAG: hypothetical protein CM1200mP15_15830 [Dehalococcoidia bacterium]|nr:MAG: hypothetical protein CM1200mP15_15830 [Dehalococcoidia bacterium]
MVFGEWTKDMLDRIKTSGYKAICITVDTASYSNRERPLLSRWVPMSQRNPPDPVWQASVTWETIERIRDYVDLPLMIKRGWDRGRCGYMHRTWRRCSMGV